MLVEQAFMALPERLLGSRYIRLTHEHGLLPAFMLGLLEELNSRNVPNPAAALCGERDYELGSSRRADLYLDLSPLNVLTPELHRYGFQPNNWIEGKFFRLNAAGKPTQNRSINTFTILGDLIRLCTLIPPEHQPTVSRYFLHVYEQNPASHVAPSRKVIGAPHAPRKWLEALWKAGVSIVDIQATDNALESAGFDEHVGIGLRALDMKLTVKNWVLTPPGVSDPGFFCYLTHIVQGVVSHSGHFFNFTETTHDDRTEDATRRIRAIVLAA